MIWAEEWHKWQPSPKVVIKWPVVPMRILKLFMKKDAVILSVGATLHAINPRWHRSKGNHRDFRRSSRGYNNSSSGMSSETEVGSLRFIPIHRLWMLDFKQKIDVSNVLFYMWIFLVLPCCASRLPNLSEVSCDNVCLILHTIIGAGLPEIVSGLS